MELLIFEPLSGFFLSGEDGIGERGERGGENERREEKQKEDRREKGRGEEEGRRE